MKSNTEIVYDGTQKKFVPLDEASVPITDLVVLRGYGIQEHVRTYSQAPFCLDEHLDRLQDSADILGIKPVPDKKYISEQISRGLENFDDEVYLKILLTGGSGKTLKADDPARLYILFLNFDQFRHPADYYDGVNLKSHVFQREFPKAKTTGYLSAVVAGGDIKSGGYDDILYIDENNLVKEGSTFNIAGIFENKLITPEEDVLVGITMGRAMEYAEDLGMQVRRDNIKLDDLYKADEVLITSTTREIVPVLSIDDQKIGTGMKGAFTEKMIHRFKQETENYGRE